jgi:diguanylate cyclase (GGDEF)-like protein/PAS domain S-box-containing protein
MYEIFGRDPTSGPATGEELFAYVHPEDRERLAAGYAQAFGGGPAFELGYRIVAGSGIERTVHAVGHEDPARGGCYLGTVQDVTGRRRAELALREAQERFRHAFQDAPIGMALISEDGLLEQANTALGVICGRTRDELVGVRLRELVHPADADSVSEALRGLGAGAIDRLAIELRIIPAAGSPVVVSVNGTLLDSGAEHSKRVLCQFQDVTERKRYEAQLQFMADHEPLTGLQNRRKFESELDRHVEHVKRYGPEGALLVVDVDHFKSVNDTLGHNAGDELIVSIASVLRGRLRTSDVLARLGGDEFAVLLPKADEAEAAQVAEALAKAVRSNTALLGGERKKVTISIGVAMFNASVEELTGETIVIEADLAMYDAKEAGGDGHAFYAVSEHRVSRTKARLTWVSRIEQALDEDRFALLAQPILDLHTGEVRQHELLVRMLDQHDDLIPPAVFLYIAERFGLIAKLDAWVAIHAIEVIEQRPELRLEVNISGRSLGDQKLLHAVDDRLRASSIDPARLIFEVTETAAVANITHTQAFAQQLRDRGCRFALDDFGAGLGSFYYLKHLPFDYVKIDGEFVQHATSGHIDQLVIEAVVRIAQGLGKETIAEFVTDEQTKRMVTRLGVDHAQGYHIGKPVPIAELLDTTSTHP